MNGPVPDPALSGPLPSLPGRDPSTLTQAEYDQVHGYAAPDRLAEIEARLAAATLLPWMKDPDDPDKVLHSTNGGFDGTVIATVQRDDYGLFEEANTDLIAHAPADLAALVAVVKAVREVADDAALPGIHRATIERRLRSALSALDAR